MAQFLIYNKQHYMDVLKPEWKTPDWPTHIQIVIDQRIDLTSDQKVKAKLAAVEKYDARHQQGDIIEVRQDGWPKSRLEPASLLFVEAPIDMAEARIYTRPLEQIVSLDERKMLRRRKYWLNTAGLVFGKDGTAHITETDFRNRLRSK